MTRPWPGSRRAIAAAAAVWSAALVAGLTTQAAAGATQPSDSAAPSSPSWVASWAMPVGSYGPTDMAVRPRFADKTIRTTARLSLGGSRVRVRLSNESGNAPLTLRAAHIGATSPDNGIAGRNVPLTFGGRRSITLKPGQRVLSDGVALHTSALSRVTVSVYAPGPAVDATGDTQDAFATYSTRSGNHAAQTSSNGFSVPSTGGLFVTAIDVYTPNDGLIVAMGDSITAGGPQANGRPWPYWLADRLVRWARAGGPRLSLVNVGISGNQVTQTRRPLSGAPSFQGAGAAERLRNDALSQSGFRTLLMMEGINDIGGDSISAKSVETALLDIAERVHRRGGRVLFSPLTPAGDLTGPTFYGLGYSSPDGVEERKALNAWIRSRPGVYTPAFDFEPVVGDKRFPNHLQLAFNSGDNLHPNQAGHRAMAYSIRLRSLLHGR